jgi:hypothetical protein
MLLEASGSDIYSGYVRKQPVVLLHEMLSASILQKLNFQVFVARQSNKFRLFPARFSSANVLSKLFQLSIIDLYNAVGNTIEFKMEK